MTTRMPSHIKELLAKLNNWHTVILEQSKNTLLLVMLNSSGEAADAGEAAEL